MPLSRRRVLTVAASVPALFVVDRSVRAFAGGARTAVAAVRPNASGTSATRCAMCGSPDHSMLDPRCPAARRVS